MTEEEWLACEDPRVLLDALRERTNNRKLRLFHCACLRWAVSLVAGLDGKWLLSVAEDYADGAATLKGIVEATSTLNRYAQRLRPTSGGWPPAEWTACQAIKSALYTSTDNVHHRVAYWLEYTTTPRPDTGEQQNGRQEATDLLRDVFGNPFRPVTFSPDWRTDTAVALARQMYDSREFSAMPILADALQDAGCDNDDILTHCRAAGEHVRGCWVVDLVLGFDRLTELNLTGSGVTAAGVQKLARALPKCRIEWDGA